jgi:hypothetical protein
MSAQITFGGDDAKNASTICAIFLQGPHHVAPSFTITNPGFAFNKFKKTSLVSKTLIICFVNDIMNITYE